MQQVALGLEGDRLGWEQTDNFDASLLRVCYSPSMLREWVLAPTPVTEW